MGDKNLAWLLYLVAWEDATPNHTNLVNFERRIIVANIRKVVRPERDEWLKLRRSYIGGSDAAAVLGLNSYSSPYSVWCEKKGITPDFIGNLATDVGTYLEEFIAQKFAQETGKKVRRNNYCLFNDEYPWAMADIDRDIVGENAGLECKSTSALNLKQFKGGEYPARYYVQCVHYLAVTGYDRWYLAVLIGNSDFKIFTIERDEEEISALMEQEKEFKTLMDGDVPPQADGSEATEKAIRAQADNADIDLDTVYDMQDVEVSIDKLYDLKKQSDDINAQMDAIKQQIMVKMEKFANGRTEHYKLIYRPQERRTFDWKAMKRAYADLDIDPFFKVSRSRTLRIDTVEKKEE